MRIVHWGRARKFILSHPQSKAPLERWKESVRKAHWKHLNDVRECFNSADRVSECIIFDIGGNNLRLLAIVTFKRATVYIRYVMTHEDYDKGKWRG